MERRTFLGMGLSAAAAAAVPLQAAIAPVDPRLRVRFGVNYTPSRNWWYCWNDWQPDSMRRDLDAIAALGADHVRILLIWPFFQPNAAWVSPAHLERLDEMLGELESRHMDAVVTAFTGQLSGLYFVPPFVDPYTHGASAFYTDGTMLAAQRLFLRELGSVLGRHRNILALDLGNELNTCWPAAVQEGDPWLRLAFSMAAGAAPGIEIVNGVDHQPWFLPTTFSPRLLASAHLPVIHCYPWWTGALKYGGPLDPPSVSLISGMAALVRAYAGNPAKPVWCEEFNTCIPDESEQQNARWLELAVVAAMENGVAWFTYWDSHDVAPKFQFSPVEYHLGLLTNDGSVKEQGKKFAELVKVYGGKQVVTHANIPAPPADPTMTNTWRWLLDWMAYKPRTA